MSSHLRIDVFFDFICPWCLIGKRQLDRAQDLLRLQQPGVEITTQWHGVQLLPHLPVQGEPFTEFYRQRLGSAEAVSLRQLQVQRAAMAVGAAIDLSRIAIMPNTADAHRLLARASVLGDSVRRDALLERLFAAYFRFGEDLGCPQTLLAIGQACGYDKDELADCLKGDASPFSGNDVAASGGVPSFQFNGCLTTVGAQPAEVLLGVMGEALQENPRAWQAV